MQESSIPSKDMVVEDKLKLPKINLPLGSVKNSDQTSKEDHSSKYDSCSFTPSPPNKVPYFKITK